MTIRVNTKAIEKRKDLERMNNKKLNRRAVTLIEILLVLALVGLFATGFGFGIKRALYKGRFQSDVCLLKAQVARLERLALFFHADIALELKQTKEGTLAKVRIESPLSPIIRKKLEKVVVFATISKMIIDGKQGQEVTLTFPEKRKAQSILLLDREGKPAELIEIKKNPYAQPKAYPEEILSSF